MHDNIEKYTISGTHFYIFIIVWKFKFYKTKKEYIYVMNYDYKCINVQYININEIKY